MSFTIFKRKSKLGPVQETVENPSGAANDPNHAERNFILKNNNSVQYLKIAAFAPHADDIELGCGATLARLVDEANAHLYYYLFITRQRDLAGAEISPYGRLNAAKQAFKFMMTGNEILTEIEKNQDEFVVHQNQKYGKFTFFRQFNRELYLDKENIMTRLRQLQISELADVDVVFLPSSKDNHHDHKMLFELASQVFRKQECVLSYRTVATSIYPLERFNPNIFIESSQEINKNGPYSKLSGNGSKTVIPGKLTYTDVKLKLISFFTMEQEAEWFDQENFLSIMKVFANEANLFAHQDKKKYAEAFEGIIRI